MANSNIPAAFDGDRRYDMSIMDDENGYPDCCGPDLVCYFGYCTTYWNVMY